MGEGMEGRVGENEGENGWNWVRMEGKWGREEGRIGEDGEEIG